MKFTFLNGENGEQSSKRLFTFILVILFTMVIVSNLYWKYALKDSLEDWLCSLIIVTFFGVLAEKVMNVWSVVKGKTSIDKTTTTQVKEVKTETSGDTK